MQRKHRVNIQHHGNLPVDPRITYFPPVGGPVRENRIDEMRQSLQEPMRAAGNVVHVGAYPTTPIRVTLIERNHSRVVTAPQRILQGRKPISNNTTLFRKIYTQPFFGGG